MLHDEVIRQEARQSKASSVLVANTAPSTQQNQPDNNTQPTGDQNSNQYPNSYRGCGRGRTQNYRGKGGRGRGRFGASNWAFQNQMGQLSCPQWAWWNTPPCPYPTQQSWRPNLNPYPAQTPTPFSANFAGYPALPSTAHLPSIAGLDALSPLDLSAAFSTMQLQHTDPNLIMDTGVERHITDNRVSQKTGRLLSRHNSTSLTRGKILPVLRFVGGYGAFVRSDGL